MTDGGLTGMSSPVACLQTEYAFTRGGDYKGQLNGFLHEIAPVKAVYMKGASYDIRRDPE